MTDTSIPYAAVAVPGASALGVAPDPNAAVISTAQTAAINLGEAIDTAADSVAIAVQADASRLAVKDEAKAESWIDREWQAIVAKMHAAIAEAEAYFKAKL